MNTWTTPAFLAAEVRLANREALVAILGSETGNDVFNVNTPVGRRAQQIVNAICAADRLDEMCVYDYVNRLTYPCAD